MDMEELIGILGGVYTDVLVTDGAGVITMVAPSFEQLYGIAQRDIVGKTVYEMEAAGVFRPSVTALVLESGEAITTTQKMRGDHEVVVSATPIRDGDGRIVSVVSYSRDLTALDRLRVEYGSLRTQLDENEKELRELRGDGSAAGGVIAHDASSLALIRLIEQIAPFDTSVLLLGESGVGKNLFARMIHEKSGRAAGRFVEINCGAIPEALLESELFGYERGSFTGANREGKKGLIEAADGGTLFLDEITELPLALQVKLLKAVQGRTVLRVGGERDVPVDFRLVSATNRDIASLVESGDFRNDLYYRLNVVSVEVPPLRGRKDDIVPLIAHTADRINRRYGLAKEFSKDAYEALARYDWPGNVRELENLVERVIITSGLRVIRAADLPEHVREGRGGDAGGAPLDGALSLPELLERVEKGYYEQAYRTARTTTGVASLLGVSQPTAARKLKRYGIS